jgi:hypothetical protein
VITSEFQTKILYGFLISLMLAACPVHVTLLDLMIQIIFGEGSVVNSSYCRQVFCTMKTALVVIVTLTSLASAADDATPSKDVEVIAPKDRPLYVRIFPGIFGHSSNLYEIPMHPYHFVSTVTTV